MNAKALVRLRFPSEEFLSVVLKTLGPEIKSMPTTRSRVQMEGKDNELTLKFEAKDTSALRAIINSYLRQTRMVIETIELIEKRRIEL
jgi:KEOPS complex subunit Pcc1